jgi:hypothetical protein
MTKYLRGADEDEDLRGACSAPSVVAFAAPPAGAAELGDTRMTPGMT